MTGRRRAALVAVPLLLLTACGPQPGAADPGGGSAPPVAAPGDVGDVVLRVEQTGGFVPPNVLVSRLPTATVYGDGRLITDGPIPAIYPGPAFPNLQQVTLPADEVDRLVERAVAAGVGAAADLGQPPVADAPSTRFTVATDTGVKTLEVVALNEADDAASGLTDAQRAARGKLRDLVTALQELSARPDATAYEAEQVAGIATAWVASDPSLPKPAEVAWSGPALPGDPVGTGLDVGCVVTDGAELRSLVASSGANSATPWSSGGKVWSVVLRPLLPDETGCADLSAVR
jgi:hypothetical protein